MTGLLARIKEQPREVLDAIAASMNVRASEPAMQAICARYMTEIALPAGARVLEVGCGNGAATRLIMHHLGPAQLVGIDPSPVFVDMAAATAGKPRVSFAVGDAAATGQADAFFDLVIAHRLLAPPRSEASADRGQAGSQAGWAARHLRRRFRNSHRRPGRGRSAADCRRSGAA